MDTSTFSPESLNPLLEERFQLLRLERRENQQDYNRVKQSVDFLNAILYQAIVHHAPDFNAVEIRASIDPNRDCIDLIDSGGNRSMLVTYLKKLGVKKEQGRSPFTFVMHLPYYDRQGRTNSDHTVTFEYGFSREHPPAQLRMDLIESFPDHGMINHVRLSLDELLAPVRLVKVEDSEFSPYYTSGDKPLEPADSALLNYLKFRSFSGLIGQEQDAEKIEDAELRARIEPVIEHVLLPDFDLFNTRHRDNTFWLLGFVAHKGAGGWMLYDFTDYRVPKELVRQYKGSEQRLVYAAEAVQSRMHLAGTSPTIYTGHEAVKRLHEHCKFLESLKQIII